MIGKFYKVKKVSSLYCFINGNDGNTYFCHISCLKDSHDWKYVWNGNECAFTPGDVKEDGKNFVASNVIPVHVLNPRRKENKLAEKLAAERREEKNRKKEENIRRAQLRKESKDWWDQHVQDHLYYVVTVRIKGTKDPYVMAKPYRAWKNKLLAEENLCFRNAENGDVFSYHLRKCVVYRKGAGYVVKVVTGSRNKIGDVLYEGRLMIDA